MPIADHRRVSGFSGNEIFCLNKLGYRPGQLCLGNNVLALGVIKGIGAGLSNLAGGEVTEITEIIRDGRKNAYDRLLKEASHYGGVGLAGITFDLINHGSNLEFLAFGSTIHSNSGGNSGGDGDAASGKMFSTFADAQQLYCQIDCGFTPHGFVFGNIAYSIGIGGNIGGALRGLKRGEVPQYTDIFNRTRHLALSRIKKEAIATGANAVLGINTTIRPLLGAQEMLMLGTAASHPLLAGYAKNPVTSDMTNEELWNMINIGYMPISLVMGVSVYSLGIASGLASLGKSLAGGHVGTLTELLYEAREKAFERIQEDAEKYKADEVIGVKTYVYELGGGIIEVLAIGTAVKKMEGVGTKGQALPPQAIIQDRETFTEIFKPGKLRSDRLASARRTQRGPVRLAISLIVFVFIIVMKILEASHRH